MAGLRKASAYSKRKARPYTRKSKVRKKSYIKTIPPTKIVKMRMGNQKAHNNNKYPVKIIATSKEKVQVRDNAIEAIRQYLNRFLPLRLGKDWYLELKIYPHHILRENKMLTGAGSDRMQTGMSQSFGKAIGRAAFVKPNQDLFFITIPDRKQEPDVRKLISSIKARLPCKISVNTEILKQN